MIALPAVDLRGGRCVQLVGGRPEEERVSLPDPVAVAERWHAEGFAALHVVDLDAALGRGDNVGLVEELVRATPAEVQVGGGIRDDARAERLLDSGAARIVVGTRALDDREWLDALAARHPGRVVLAVDARAGKILRRGWTEETSLELLDFLPMLDGLPLAAVLSTDVGREGRVLGIDRAAVAETVAASPHPVQVAGGVSGTDDLEHLADVGAAAAVLGMALYTGALDARGVAVRWGAYAVEEKR